MEFALSVSCVAYYELGQRTLWEETESFRPLREFRSCSPCYPTLDPGGIVSSTNGTAGQGRVGTWQFVEMDLDHATGCVMDTSESLHPDSLTRSIKGACWFYS